MTFKKTLCATRPSKPWCMARSRLRSALCRMHSFGFAMRYALCALLFLEMLGCQATLSKFLPPLVEEGEIYVYLQPFPQEAERLRFNFEKISAMSEDGREIPLTMALQQVKGPALRRQRLLASGPLSPGRYTGLSFGVKNAVVRVEDGEAALLVPEGPSRIEFPFTIVKRKSLVIALVFKYDQSITGRINFSPVFSPFIPSKPINSLVGYVTNSDSNNLALFDKKLGQVVGIIPTGSRPRGMTLDQRSMKVYVALSGEDAIEVIDIMAGDVVNRIRLNMGDRPQEVALTPDGRLLLTANTGSNTVSFVDTISLFESNRINVGNGPNSILIDHNGRRAFVFNNLSSTISVIDIPNRGIVTTISTDPGPLRGQFNRRGDRLYVIHELSSYLSVIDPSSLSTLRRFSVRIGMNSMKVDPRTDLVYLGRKQDPAVEIYDPFSFVPVDSIRTGGGITYMTIDRDESTLYMVSPRTRSLLVSSLVSKKTAFEIDVGEGPYWVVVMGER